MASFGIGAKLRQERVGKGLGIADIARDTRIAARFLEAIEKDDYSILPGLVFTRNFVRQYALTLQLDPDPLLAALPKQDELTALLPNPPAHRRSSNRPYQGDRQIRSIVSSIAWIVVAGLVGGGTYLYFSHSPRSGAPKARPASVPAVSPPVATLPVAVSSVTTSSVENQAIPDVAIPATAAAAVRVSLTAHEAAWVQLSVDGKTTFTGTLQANETKEISAAEQVKVLTGNAGALTISLNGKTLESLGPLGQVREVRLTAEGLQSVSKAPQPLRPAPDPL